MRRPLRFIDVVCRDDDVKVHDVAILLEDNVMIRMMTRTDRSIDNGKLILLMGLLIVSDDIEVFYASCLPRDAVIELGTCAKRSGWRRNICIVVQYYTKENIIG